MNDYSKLKTQCEDALKSIRLIEQLLSNCKTDIINVKAKLSRLLYPDNPQYTDDELVAMENAAKLRDGKD